MFAYGRPQYYVDEAVAVVAIYLERLVNLDSATNPDHLIRVPSLVTDMEKVLATAYTEVY